MRFFSIFQPTPEPDSPPITSDRLPQLPRLASDPLPQSEAIRTYPNPTEPIRGENNFFLSAWFLPTQLDWLNDPHHLRIWEKSRQVGATKTDALDSVLKASPADARFDVWVTSRDEVQACLYLEDCKEWAKILHLAATDLGLQVLDPKHPHSAHVLQFANGRRIYCLSSNPNALAGKRGHVKIDEFALHPDQRLLYRIAKPVTQWGGTLSIISTHRGPNCLFAQIIRDIRLHGNPMGWHIYSFPIHKAVAEGLVARINLKSGRNESDEQFLQRTQAECIDKEQWDQEYCCIPSDESTAFLTHELITACEDPGLCLYSMDELIAAVSGFPRPSDAGSPRPIRWGEGSGVRGFSDPQLFAGLDIARTTNLCVLDVGEKIGDLMYDRLRLELRNTPFPEIRAQLYRLLRLPQLQRCCIDANGLGMQLAEEAQLEFGSKVEPVRITAPVKEKLAFALRADFEDRKLRLPHDDKLRADLRGIKKEVSPAGNIRFLGDTDDSHCDRFWAKALRQEAARHREEVWFLLG